MRRAVKAEPKACGVVLGALKVVLEPLKFWSWALEGCTHFLEGCS